MPIKETIRKVASAIGGAATSAKAAVGRAMSSRPDETAAAVGAVGKWMSNDMPGLPISMSEVFQGGKLAQMLGKVGRFAVPLWVTWQLANLGSEGIKYGVNKLLGTDEELDKKDAERAAKLKPSVDAFLAEEEKQHQEEQRIKQKGEGEADLGVYSSIFASQSAHEEQAMGDIDKVAQRSIAGQRTNNAASRELAYQIANGKQIDPSVLGGIAF